MKLEERDLRDIKLTSLDRAIQSLGTNLDHTDISTVIKVAEKIEKYLLSDRVEDKSE